MSRQSLTIPTASLPDPGTDYVWLREHMVRLTQNMSGGVWTDYNASDPGVPPGEHRGAPVGLEPVGRGGELIGQDQAGLHLLQPFLMQHQFDACRLGRDLLRQIIDGRA